MGIADSMRRNKWLIAALTVIIVVAAVYIMVGPQQYNQYGGTEGLIVTWNNGPYELTATQDNLIDLTINWREVYLTKITVAFGKDDGSDLTVVSTIELSDNWQGDDTYTDVFTVTPQETGLHIMRIDVDSYRSDGIFNDTALISMTAVDEGGNRLPNAPTIDEIADQDGLGESSLTLVVTWTAAEDPDGTVVQYIVDLSRNNTFSPTETDTTTTLTASISIAITSNGEYFVRVAAEDDAGGIGAYSETESFLVTNIVNDDDDGSGPPTVPPPEIPFQPGGGVEIDPVLIIIAVVGIVIVTVIIIMYARERQAKQDIYQQAYSSGYSGY